ncbi:pyrroline-5-carboxylate reductase [Patescibacteria group bacterium]
MLDFNIGILGAGNMGAALCNSLDKKYGSKNLFICDLNQKKLDELPGENKYLSKEISDFVGKCDVLILAIKPQSFVEISQELKNENLENVLVISIMAGITIESLKKATNAKKIVRAMPNLAVKFQEGITGWTGTSEVDPEEVDSIFQVTGEVVRLDDEEKVDAITALSGSGPAYFFHFAEVLAEVAKEFGFSDNQANLIAKQTLIGAAKAAEFSSDSLSELREAVTSKGGTTAAALKHLGDNKFAEIFKNSIKEAKKRAKELNK